MTTQRMADLPTARRDTRAIIGAGTGLGLVYPISRRLSGADGLQYGADSTPVDWPEIAG